jgi:hypothetical protein
MNTILKLFAEFLLWVFSALGTVLAIVWATSTVRADCMIIPGTPYHYCGNLSRPKDADDGEPYVIHVKPPTRFCEITTVTKVWPADEQCRNGKWDKEFGDEPPAPQDGDLHGCSGAGAGGIEYANGVHQSGEYAYVPAMEHSKRGDRVMLCLTEFENGCPSYDGKIDDRGIEYSAYNFRTHGRWHKPNSSHGCGGA